MKNATIKNALVGIVHALVAAYLFPVALATLGEGSSGFMVLFTVIPFYGLLYSFWIVIPLGAALGMLIPQMARGKTRWVAALYSAGYGAIGGFVSFLCFASVLRLRLEMDVFWISAILYCALWVGGYAFYCAKGQSLYR